MSLADIYMQIAGQNRADRERMRDQLQSMAGNVASIIKSNQQNAAANATLNKLDPPRAEAVNPQHPEAVKANKLYGGPTKPHTGGVAARDVYEKEQQLLDQQDARLKRRQAMNRAADRILGINSTPEAARVRDRAVNMQPLQQSGGLTLSPELAKQLNFNPSVASSVAGLPLVASAADRQALPPGALYRLPNGGVMQKGN